MDGFETNEGVILIAATNRPDVLDPALSGPGASTARSVARPDVRGARRSSRSTRRILPPPIVDLKVPFRGTPGSGADSPTRQRGGVARRATGKSVEMIDFENAKDNLLMASSAAR